MKYSQRRCEMKFYDELEAVWGAIELQIADAKKIERSKALKVVKRLCKDLALRLAR